jgi:hypothetical protein
VAKRGEPECCLPAELKVGAEEVGLKLNWKQKMKLSEKNEIVVVRGLPKISGY